MCKVKQRQIKKIYICLRLTARGKEQQEKRTNKCRQNNNRFKKLKEEGKKKKKENSTELQKPNAEAEVYNNNKKCD